MAEILDFNQYRPPVLTVVLRDENATRLSVKLPTVDMQEELRANSAGLMQLIRQEDDKMVEAVYDLAARLMSNNRNLKKISSEQLRTTYCMEGEDIALFFERYTAFMQGVEQAKN